MTRESAYQAAVDYLFSLEFFGIKLGLANIKRLLELCHDPQAGQNFIQIAGSNGKGSVAAMTEAVLLAAGKTTGLFTSPHLVDFRERIRINQQPVSETLIVELVEYLRPLIQQVAGEPDLAHPTYFEVNTALALLAFVRHGVDWALLEVGMGGRLDATSAVKPKALIITNISLEHSEYLGDTIEEVAAEKAGAIKNGVPVFTCAEGAALEVIRDVCFKRSSPCYDVDMLGSITMNRPFENGQLVSIVTRRHRYDKLFIPLPGRHQGLNALLAISVLEHLEQITPATVRQGLANTFWAGRIMPIDKEPLTVIDGAHNMDAVAKLFATIKENFSYQRLHVVLAVLKDKNVAAIIDSPILEEADTIIATQVQNTARSLSAEKLAAVIKEHGKTALVIDSSEQAVAQARSLANHDDLVLVFGSLYLVGEIFSLPQYSMRREQ